MNALPNEAELQQSNAGRSRFSDSIDFLSNCAGVISAAALLLIVSFVCFEVVSRSFFNEPTVWVTEYATYLLMCIAFVGLAYAQKQGSHIRVELLLGYLKEPLRQRLELLTHWIGLFFVVFAAWQMVSFNYQEYVNDTRNWGLLATRQWIPELFVSIGYGLFSLAILADINRLSNSARRHTWWICIAVFCVLVVLLCRLGPYPLPIKSLPLDWGSLCIAIAFPIAIWAWSGARLALGFSITLTAVACLFYWGQGQPLLPVGLLLILAMLFFLLSGVRIALALGSVGMMGLYFLLQQPQLSLLAERSWNSINSFTLTAIPMFVFMGGLLLRSGATTEMFDALRRWFGKTPGGIAHASIGACGIFAAVSGSSLATAATMGAVACPEMIKRGYSTRLTYGVIAAGGTLGILIPPSIAMIIYGTTVGAPITVLFIAGIVPGLLLMASFMAAVFVWSIIVKGAGPKGRGYSLGEKLGAMLGVLPFLTLIIVVLGSLYLGVATPTEAGGIGAVIALLLCAQRGKFSWNMLMETALETVKVTSFLLLIVAGASILSWVFDALGLPASLVAEVQAVEFPPWVIMAIIAMIYILLGMFIDPISMMLMTLPVAYPIVITLGFDPVWFGITLVLMIEVGMITPPVGIILFVLRGISGDVSMDQIVYGVLPFVAVILLNVVLIYIYPSIVLWLPGLMQ
ncbi:TRAP transporter large permease subunit [Pelagibius sp. Alg239-R121]|uniref:TRAP transporter large permease subunit n=1 Tax=Pelagibius sp. Alg239-R121 TaxID=2993448 RepID=UPI0024A6B3D7|nr:TRAP transporter large permease subunit [Pelagibius sp. Alg239-R121]